MIGVARGEGRKQGKRNLSTYLANIFRDRLYPRASHDHDHLLCISMLSSRRIPSMLVAFVPPCCIIE